MNGTLTAHGLILRSDRVRKAVGLSYPIVPYLGVYPSNSGLAHLHTAR